jgi:transketolase
MDQLAIDTMRMLAVDAVQKSRSGHPGTLMDAAPAASPRRHQGGEPEL